MRTEGFRNLEAGTVEPCEGVNVIWGDNAQGKTNLLEALWLFTGGRSFRGAKDSELPHLDPVTGENAPQARLCLEYFAEEREQKIDLALENGKRSCVINGVKKKNGAALVGKVRAVIFSPEHLLLVKEGPSRRRAFLDGALCQWKPAHAAALSLYSRALLQRNALLKDMSRYPELRDTLEIWDQRLAELGVTVLLERMAFAQKLEPRVREIYRGISQGREEITLQYSPSIPQTVENPERDDWKRAFLRELERTLPADRRSGFTTAGCHRDDLDLKINGASARAYGSQGQQRSAVLALKLAEAETLTEVSGEAPIVLLDDVMSELDRNRQDYLLNHLDSRQVFLTCCSPETVSLQKTGKRFFVQRGRVRAEEV